jgi:hypothetical protein
VLSSCSKFLCRTMACCNEVRFSYGRWMSKAHMLRFYCRYRTHRRWGQTLKHSIGIFILLCQTTLNYDTVRTKCCKYYELCDSVLDLSSSVLSEYKFSCNAPKVGVLFLYQCPRTYAITQSAFISHVLRCPIPPVYFIKNSNMLP